MIQCIYIYIYVHKLDIFLFLNLILFDLRLFPEFREFIMEHLKSQSKTLQDLIMTLLKPLHVL